MTKPNDVKDTLQKPNIHHKWENAYQTPENYKFFDYVFDYLFKSDNEQENSTAVILDAGCGTGKHTARLLSKGFSVTAIDISEYVIADTKSRLSDHEAIKNAQFKQQDITALSFPDNSFDYILCWGTLMHVADIEKALSELSRVLKNDGVLILGENNMLSLQSLIKKSVSFLSKEVGATVNKTAAGQEKWLESSQGPVLTRHTDMGWLKKELARNKLLIEKHVAGQFTEIYTKFPNGWINKFIHSFNNFWFLHIKIPYLALGNIIVARKNNTI